MTNLPLQDPNPPATWFETLEGWVETLGVDLAVVVQKAANVLLLLAVGWFALRLLRKVTARVLARVQAVPGRPASDSHARMRTLMHLLNSIGAAVIVIAVGLTILGMFIDIGPLLAGVGVLGLAFSFGAQSLVKDVIAGFFMLFENQFDVGDVVEIGGVSGVVERLTLRVVAVRDLRGVLHVIPNGSISQVSNMTSDWSRAVVDVGIAYDADVDHAIAALKEIADALWNDESWSEKFIEAPAVLGVNELGDSAVVLRVLVKTIPGTQWEVSREIRRRIKIGFDSRGIEIPFPQRTVHMRTST